MAGLHERIHERGQHGAGAENDQRSEEEQHEDQGHEPPFLFLAKKEEELFEQQPHADGEASRRRADWQTQTLGVSAITARIQEGRLFGPRCLRDAKRKPTVARRATRPRFCRRPHLSAAGATPLARSPLAAGRSMACFRQLTGGDDRTAFGPGQELWLPDLCRRLERRSSS